MDGIGKADIHIHTYYSGYSNLGLLKFPESVTTPEKQVDCARKHGMDVICITDHNAVRGGFAAQRYAKRFDDIEVVVGDEIMTADGELIGYDLNEYIEPFLSVEETADLIKEQGGLTVAPHPFSFHVNGLGEKLFDIDLDAMEVINGGHPDRYSNPFAQKVVERFPDRWAAVSSSDSHSNYTMGYNWTEFEGSTADELRRAILARTTVPRGVPAPVLGNVQWSYEVALGGQKLMYRSLKKRLVPADGNALIDKVLSLNDLKKATAIFAGILYCMPPVSFLATTLSTSFLGIKAKKMNAHAEERLEGISDLLETLDLQTRDGDGDDR